ncbi:MAG: hypothetical protein JNJ45_07370 [Chthonomonas sp.]|nr:hypothetical protein [Chthonomonas sp.]
MLTAAIALLSFQTVNAADFSLTDEQMSQLKTTKQSLYLPTYIPRDFKTAVGVDTHTDPHQVSYHVDYVLGPKEFWVQSASDGIGDIFLQDEDGKDIEGTKFVVVHKQLGKIEVMIGPKSFRRWAVNWIEVSKSGFPKYISLGGNGLEPATIKRILLSLQRIP